MHKGNKTRLPEKACETCKRPFVWRKKWKSSWPAVKYCSERCRRHRNTVTGSYHSNA
ncbi:MAG: DUF2256 domain-containing protein [Gammaproteobacteria bacterium]